MIHHSPHIQHHHIIIIIILSMIQTIVLYPRPHIITCTLRIWLREIGFALSYGALMLKTWRWQSSWESFHINFTSSILKHNVWCDYQLLQDFCDFSCEVGKGCEDHRHGPYQEAWRHRRHVHPLPYHTHSYGSPKRLCCCCCCRTHIFRLRGAWIYQMGWYFSSVAVALFNLEH